MHILHQYFKCAIKLLNVYAIYLQNGIVDFAIWKVWKRDGCSTQLLDCLVNFLELMNLDA